jgi:hypothetical protein
VRELGAIHLLQVVQDVADGHAVRVQADDHVVEAAGDPPGPLGHQQRLEGPRTVAGHLQAHRPDPGLHFLADRAVAGVAGVMPRRVMPLIAQAGGQPGAQRPFQDRLHQLPEHGPLTGQSQPPGLVPRPFQQRINQPVIDQLAQRSHHPVRSGGIFPAVRSSLPQTRPGFRCAGQPCRSWRMVRNRHVRCSPPVTAAIPTGHSVPFDHSLHTWRDTPGGFGVHGVGMLLPR